MQTNGKKLHSRSDAYHHLYTTRTWTAMRRAQLAANPLCCICHELGRVTHATVVNHIVPHKGDWDRFTDPANLQSVCKPHHDGLIQAQERGGFIKGSVNGRPRDPEHPWNRAKMG